MRLIRLTLILIIFQSCHGQEKQSSIKVNNNPDLQLELPKAYKPLKEFKMDTLSYVDYNFVMGKANFVSKNFSYFLQTLEVPIVRFIPIIDDTDESLVNGIYIQFITERDVSLKVSSKIDPTILIIYFEKPLSYIDLVQISKLSNDSWSVRSTYYFGPKKIKDIIKVIYNFNPPRSRKETDSIYKHMMKNMKRRH